MQLPLQQAAGALGLDAWLNGSATPLAVAAHPSGALLALARGYTLTVLPLQHQRHDSSDATAQQEAATAALHAVHQCRQQYTALAWFVQLRSSKQATPAGTRHPQQRATSPQYQQQWQPEEWRQQQQQQHIPQSAAEAAADLLECEVLLSGTADGCLQLHSSTGQVLFKQRLSANPVLDILTRTHCSGLCSGDPSEEVCVTFSNALVRINTLHLRSQMRMLQLAQGGHPSAAAAVSPLPLVRYDFPAAVGPRISGMCLGLMPPDLYSLLSSSATAASGAGNSSSSNMGGSSLVELAGMASRQIKQKVCLVTVGRAPCLASFEAEEQPSRSTLAALVGLASSLTTGVVGAASRAAGLGPSMVKFGVKTLMRPLSSLVTPHSRGLNNPYHDGNSSAIAFDDLQLLPKPAPVSLTRQLRDDDRVLEGLVPAPCGALLAAQDNLGRLMLLDGASTTAVRIWKGYRDAQCGWLLPPPSHPAHPLGLLLVLLAPKRQVLEVWLPKSGQRLASRPVDYPCLLVSVGLPCGAWGNERIWSIWQEQFGSATTLVMNVQTGYVEDAIDCLMEE